MIDRKRQY